MSKLNHIVVTGGHHTSALPVIDLISEKNPEIKVTWIGHKYSMLGDKNPTLEYREITERKIPFYSLTAGKVYKTFNLMRWLKLPFGFFQAVYYLIKLHPDAILSFGGYIAAPVVFAGWLLRIPSVTHEQTVVAGYANRFISYFAKKILVSWPSSQKYFPPSKTFFTGLPIRKQIFENNSNNLEFNKNLPNIYITAGKTGSHKINKVVSDCLPDLLRMCNVIHQCGDHSVYKDYQRLTEKYKSIKAEGKYNLRKFVLFNEIGHVYANSDVVISRAGAHTVIELLALEKPCILIPIPWVSHNEQYENARVLEDSGLGVILEEKDLSPEYFIEVIRRSLNNLEEYKIKDPSVKSVVNLNAEEEIVKQLLSVKN